MDTFELFTRAGMTKKEASIYATLLEKGVLSLSDISKETHINRPALYALLPKMARNGFVTQIKKQKRTLYQAESPLKLLESYKEDREEVEKLLVQCAHEHKEGPHQKPLIKYFEGKKAVTFVFDDIIHTLPKGGIFFRYTSRTGDSQSFAQTYYTRMRDVRGLERMVITGEQKAKEKAQKLERSVKSIPKDFDLFQDNVSLVIYGDKTAYIDYSSQTSFIVESAKIARFQEKLFRLLYKKL